VLTIVHKRRSQHRVAFMPEGHINTNQDHHELYQFAADGGASFAADGGASFVVDGGASFAAVESGVEGERPLNIGKTWLELDATVIAAHY
jgi:hypothetical protein